MCSVKNFSLMASLVVGVSLFAGGAVENAVGINVHQKVQLWKNGPYWATANIGADHPWEYGYYFWWGDTVGYKRENNKWVASDGSNSDFSFVFGNTSTYGKDNRTLQSEGWITADGVLKPEYDAARKHWGGDWRMPTIQEIEALNDNCDWSLTTTNGVRGYVVRGRGDYSSASIFIPRAGRGYMTWLNFSGSYGYYWSSIAFPDEYNVRYLYFNANCHYSNHDSRYYGLTVRPLQSSAK